MRSARKNVPRESKEKKREGGRVEFLLAKESLSCLEGNGINTKMEMR